MARDVQKTAETGARFLQKHERLELSVDELHQLFGIYNTSARESGHYRAIWDVIGTAFRFGVEVGRRNA